MTDATEPVPLIRADDDDEVRTIFASHLDEVRVRTAPASLDTRAHPARAEHGGLLPKSWLIQAL